MLSTYSGEEYSDLSIQEGAAGYLTKNQAPAQLIDAIRKVSQDK
jgi:DNA-binding NarL/FixJ family response regulator